LLLYTHFIKLCPAPPIAPVIIEALMNTHTIENIDRPNAHHPRLLLFNTIDTTDRTKPMKEYPHDAQPQQAPPKKLHAAASDAKHKATTPRM
jgi:hypothetical protein